MKGAALALLLAAACGPARPSSEPDPAPVASASAAPVASASVTPAGVEAGAPAPAAAFRVVREAVHPREKASPFVARLGNRVPGAAKLAPIDPKAGALAGAAADTACYVASGLTTDMDATCSATLDSVSSGPVEITLAATVDVGFEDDTMQSRAKTAASLKGTVTLDAKTHEVVRASFHGTERFEERGPCEKNAGCEGCDPLVRRAACAAKCYCPFRPAGTADVETSYGG